jgi:MFS family permease
VTTSADKTLNSGFQYFTGATSVYALGYFLPLILRAGMGFSYTKAQLLTSPPYVFAIIMSLATASLSDRIKMRWPIICAQCIIAVVGFLIVLYTKPPGVRYFGIFLATYGCQANAPLFLTYGQNQTAQVSKRGIVAATTISIGAVGGICGSTIFRSQDAPVRTNHEDAILSLTKLGTAISSRHLDNNRLAAHDGRSDLLHIDAPEAAKPAGG